MIAGSNSPIPSAENQPSESPPLSRSWSYRTPCGDVGVPESDIEEIAQEFGGTWQRMALEILRRAR
jgi:hypothetical protein